MADFEYVGPIVVPTPSANGHAATKQYVDNGLAGKQDIGGGVSAHASTHASGGTDPVTPAAIGAVASNDTRLSVKPYPPVALTDATTIATNAALGTHFHVTLAGNRTLGTPTNPTDGQVCTWQVTASGAARTLTLSAGFKFGTTITALTATTLNTDDLIQAMYDAGRNLWFVIGYVKGF